LTPGFCDLGFDVVTTCDLALRTTAAYFGNLVAYAVVTSYTALITRNLLVAVFQSGSAALISRARSLRQDCQHCH
jgi:hypothetical protein